jgi:hypothetical protein
VEAAILAALLKYGIPLLIELLQKYGFFDAAEALGAKTVDQLLVDVQSLKTYQEYPIGVNGASSGDPVQ